MEYRILGPVGAWIDDVEVSVGGPRERRTLAALLLNAGRMVSTMCIVDLLWGENPPRTVAAQVRNTVAKLRRALAWANGGRAPITRVGDGFVLHLGDCELDALSFERAVGRAGELVARGELAAASNTLGAGLALWRGPALGGLDGYPLDAAVHRLEEQRLACLQQRIEIDLALGRHDELVGELAALVDQHPLRERPAELYLSTLYRAGRRQDALDAFAAIRVRLADHAGLDPGPGLVRLQRVILRGDPDVELDGRSLAAEPAGQRAPPGAASVRQRNDDLVLHSADRDGASDPRTPPLPAQLPPRVPEFVGRNQQITGLDALVAGDAEIRSATLVISALSGAGGIGKTTLAVWWAHRVARLFPDGQLFADLSGFAASPPTRPIDVLARFLAALGVPGDRIPIDEGSAVALYRSMLAARRVLVVLDNAATEEQVRPLLPGEPRCLVLITSRARLTGLVATHGAQRLTLDGLRHEEALDLLSRCAGAERIAAEADAAAELVQLCGYLPLAVRIAAAQLHDVPEQALATYVSSLRAAGALNTLAIGEDPQASVHATIATSYARLTRDEQRTFRLLGAVPGPDVTAAAVAALAMQPVPTVKRTLDRLASVHLLDAPVPDRYAMHDLIHQYAVERLEGDRNGGEREAARARLFAWYLQSATAAVNLIRPTVVMLPRDRVEVTPPAVSFADAVQALDWLDAERGNLVAAVAWAAYGGPPSVAWLLADAMRGYLYIRPSMVEWLAVARAGFAAAETAGDVRGQAAAQLSLAEAFWVHGQYGDATQHYQRAVALTARARWPHGHAAALNNLANVLVRIGRLPEAASQYRRALTIRRRLSDSTGEALVLVNLGTVCYATGNLRQAVAHQMRAVELYRPARVPHGEAMALANLSEALHGLSHLAEAGDHLTRALHLARESGDRGTEAECLRLLAAVRRDTGLLEQALEYAEAAMRVTSHTDDRRFEPNLLDTLGTIHARLGRLTSAVEYHQCALHTSRQHSARGSEAKALIGMAECHTMLGRLDQARAYGRDAVALAHDAGHRILEGQANVAQAVVELASANLDAAAEHARHAMVIQRTTGHRLGEARALAVLAAAARQAGNDKRAEAWHRRAHAIVFSAGADLRILLVPDDQSAAATTPADPPDPEHASEIHQLQR